MHSTDLILELGHLFHSGPVHKHELAKFLRRKSACPPGQTPCQNLSFA